MHEFFWWQSRDAFVFSFQKIHLFIASNLCLCPFKVIPSQVDIGKEGPWEHVSARSTAGSRSQKMRCPAVHLTSTAHPRPQLLSLHEFLPQFYILSGFLRLDVLWTIACLSKPEFLRLRRSCISPESLAAIQILVLLICMVRGSIWDKDALAQSPPGLFPTFVIKPLSGDKYSRFP